jgi:predicted permease
MLAVGWLSGKLFRLGENTIGVHTATMGLPNDGLLGYPLWLAVFPDRAGLAIMASCIVYAIAQWGIAYPLTIPRGSGIKFHWKKMLTPPVIATCIGTVLVLLDVHPAGNMVWDTLAGIGMTTMKETAGIGTRLAEPDFLNQFPDKKLPVKLKADGGEIDAISGATVSSVGAMLAVSNAVAIYQEIKPLLLETWK